MKASAAGLLIVIALSCAFPVVAGAQVRNLTQSNSAAVSGKIEELQQTELIRVTRGRLKSNPIPFQLHSIYQAVIQGQDVMLAQLTQSYAGSLMRLDKVFADYKTETATARGAEIKKYFRSELIRAYDLEPALKDLNTIYQVYEELNASRVAMDALPVRASLALDALRWTSTPYSNGIAAPDELKKLDDLMRTWKRAQDVFAMEDSVSSLSAEYSKFFSQTSEKTLEGK